MLNKTVLVCATAQIIQGETAAARPVDDTLSSKLSNKYLLKFTTLFRLIHFKYKLIRSHVLLSNSSSSLKDLLNQQFR